jgi:hypothetical protein
MLKRKHLNKISKKLLLSDKNRGKILPIEQPKHKYYEKESKPSTSSHKEHRSSNKEYRKDYHSSKHDSPRRYHKKSRSRSR